MDDLISRSALLAAYDKAHQGPPGDARKLIENAPGAIVRCEYCKRWDREHDGLCPYNDFLRHLTGSVLTGKGAMMGNDDERGEKDPA